MAPVELLPASEAVPSNPKWHELRREGISASEIAAVLGISPWESPFSLYWQKLMSWETDQNAEMSAGTRAEGVIADWWAEVCDPNENLYVLRAGLYAHAARPWQLATPDRLIYLRDFGVSEHPSAALECKYLVGGWDGWGEPGTDDVPVHYRAQCLWQADVLEVEQVYLAAWHGADFREYIIRRDEKDLRVMRAAGERFMARLADDDPPDVDDHAATIYALKALHPSIEDREQEVSQATADGYRRARALKAHASDLCDRFEARLRAEMGNARKATSGGRFVASRSVYDRAGYTATVAPTTIDRLNPAREKKS